MCCKVASGKLKFLRQCTGGIRETQEMYGCTKERNIERANKQMCPERVSALRVRMSRKVGGHLLMSEWIYFCYNRHAHASTCSSGAMAIQANLTRAEPPGCGHRSSS